MWEAKQVSFRNYLILGLPATGDEGVVSEGVPSATQTDCKRGDKSRIISRGESRLSFSPSISLNNSSALFPPCDRSRMGGRGSLVCMHLNYLTFNLPSPATPSLALGM